MCRVRVYNLLSLRVLLKMPLLIHSQTHKNHAVIHYSMETLVSTFTHTQSTLRYKAGPQPSNIFSSTFAFHNFEHEYKRQRKVLGRSSSLYSFINLLSYQIFYNISFRWFNFFYIISHKFTTYLKVIRDLLPSQFRYSSCNWNIS